MNKFKEKIIEDREFEYRILWTGDMYKGAVKEKIVRILNWRWKENQTEYIEGYIELLQNEICTWKMIFEKAKKISKGINNSRVHTFENTTTFGHRNTIAAVGGWWLD